MMNFTYGKAAEAPVEEIDEMLAILRGIQKYTRELYLLTVRAQTVCPNLMDGQRHNLLREFVRHADIRFQNVGTMGFTSADEALKTHIQQLEERKRELLKEEGQ